MVSLKELIYNLFELSFHISIFDKNYWCLEKLIKITYNPYKPILAYFNKLHEEFYKKKLILKPKNDNLNGKIVILINYVKNKIFFEKIRDFLKK